MRVHVGLISREVFHHKSSDWAIGVNDTWPWHWTLRSEWIPLAPALLAAHNKKVVLQGVRERNTLAANKARGASHEMRYREPDFSLHQIQINLEIKIGPDVLPQIPVIPAPEAPHMPNAIVHVVPNDPADRPRFQAGQEFPSSATQ